MGYIAPMETRMKEALDILTEENICITVWNREVLKEPPEFWSGNTVGLDLIYPTNGSFSIREGIAFALKSLGQFNIISAA